MSSPLPHPAPPSSHTHTARRGSREEHSALYKTIMTPVNFISFILALVFIDARNSMHRYRAHHHRSAKGPCPLPSWLHPVIYHKESHVHVVETRDGYYHTKQKKLFEMEAEEAFRMRKTTIATVGAVVVALSAGGWYVVGEVFHRLGA